MKRIASLLILLAITLTLAAQNISVASFTLDEKDLTANLSGTSVEDQNGQKCALLRIQTTEKGFTFDVGVLGVQKVDDSKVGEIWVYVPAGVRRITIRHQQLGTLKDYYFPVNITAAKTYYMQLTTAQIQTIVKKAVTLAADDTQDINCRLENGRPITITAPEGADIYIDNKKVATTRYEGTLSYGNHSIYAAQADKKTDTRSLNVPMGSGALESINLAFSKTFTVNGVQFTMMLVEAGTFTMGATPEMKNPYDEERPAHQVTLTNNYYIGQTEVTQALWTAVMGSNPSSYKGDNRPVETVSWNDCQKFITELNSLTGQNFRLPTEAEWEYAARGGKNSQGYQYSGSNNLNEVAWYWKNSGDKYLSGTDKNWNLDKIKRNKSQTHDVATKRPNELGIYDMSGNVWEWCQDRYGSYSSDAQTNPTGPTSGSRLVNRGGSWYSNARLCRSSNRDNYAPGSTDKYLGLRLVLSE